MSAPDVRLLFVGEDEDDFVITRARLRDVPGVHYTLERACTPGEALPVLLGAQVDVCLVEGTLGEIDGLELVQRAVSRGCRVPFIVLMDLAPGPPADLALPSGAAVEFLNKEEITPAHLAQTVRYAIERARMMALLLDREARLKVQQKALLALATLPGTGDLQVALAEATQVAAQTLSATRCEVWLFDDEGEVLTRVQAYAEVQGPTQELPVLRADGFPALFKTLGAARIIVADEPAARADTHRFYIRYLKPRGVKSALFAPLRLGDQLLGMLACEHTKGQRRWTLDEQSFLSSITDLMSLIIQSHKQQQVEAALQESQERFALAAVGANDGLWDWVVDSESAFFSARWKSLLGHRSDEVPDLVDAWFQRIHPDDRKPFHSALRAYVNNRTPQFETEHRLAQKGGGYRWYLCRGQATRGPDGKATRLAGSLTDVTEMRTVRDELVHEIFEDRTTGMLNRTALIKALAQAIAQKRQAAQKGNQRGQADAHEIRSIFGLIVVGFEIDGDPAGGLQGRLAFAIAQRIEGLLKPDDQVARIGDHQFGLLIAKMQSMADAARIGAQIREAFADAFEFGGRSYMLHPVIGVSLSTSGYQRPEDYLEEAGRAMDRAMEVTDPTYAFAGMALGAEAHALMQLEAELNRAVRVDAFEVMYQPVLSLHSRRIVAVEALMRWASPHQGLLEPESFLDAAEETGLIVEIDQLILRRACRTFARWANNSMTPPKLLVNVSTRSVLDPRFPNRVITILTDARMKPSLLRLEICEQALTPEAEAIAEALLPLSSLGVQLNVDDYDLGALSSKALDELPIESIKVDGGRLMSMGRETEGREAIAALMASARRLGRRVIAERIETRDQAETARHIGCDHGQGVHFAPPQDIPGIEALLDPWRKTE
ncbi:MAG: EAL domain-containing protein [Bradymonadia bacterium]